MATKPTHGGARPGAGRPPKTLPLMPASPAAQSPLEFLLATMRDSNADPRLRLDAAKTAALYVHVRAGGEGKKAAADALASTAHEGTEWDSLLQ